MINEIKQGNEIGSDIMDALPLKYGVMLSEKKWVSLEFNLECLKSIQSEWKYPSREGTLINPMVMLDNLIIELEMCNK